MFRGDFRLKILFKNISSVRTKKNQLIVNFPEGEAIFYLGEKALKWAEKIKNPKSLIDKLGVKPDSKVAVVGVADNEFLKQLNERTIMATGKLAKELDFIFYAAESLKELTKLSLLKECIKKSGAIWVVSLKGKNANVKDVVVIKAAKDAGLVDVKVVSFSDTHTANKLVIPISKR